MQNDLGDREFTGSKDVKDVVLTSTGCEESEAKCTSAGRLAGHIVTNPLKGEFGYIAGKGTKTPTVGLLLQQESTTYAAEFANAWKSRSGPRDRSSRKSPATSTRSLRNSTYTFRESGGVQQFGSFEGGLPDETWRWEFNAGKGWEPEGGATFGLQLTATAKGETMEIKA